MIRTISSTELQKNTRAVIDWTRTKGEPVIVETYGKPMAALLSFDEFDEYLKYKQRKVARQERFSRLRQAAAQNAAFNTLTEEEAMTLVEQVRQEVYELSQRMAAGAEG